MFAIACRFDAARPVVYECVHGILQHHPGAEIVVVDSASPDRSYCRELRSLGIRVDEIDNRHYEAGAIWHVHERYPRDHYFFLQDSAIPTASLADLARHEVSGMMHWRDWEGCGPEHLAAGRELLAQTDYPWLERGFPMIFGSILFARRSVLDRLRAKRFDRALPTDKAGSCAMERLWGVALQHEGLAAQVERTFLSPWVGISEESSGRKVTRVPRMQKVWMGRD